MSVASLSYSNVERCMSMVVSIGERGSNVNGGSISKVSLDEDMCDWSHNLVLGPVWWKSLVMRR